MVFTIDNKQHNNIKKTNSSSSVINQMIDNNRNNVTATNSQVSHILTDNMNKNKKNDYADSSVQSSAEYDATQRSNDAFDKGIFGGLFDTRPESHKYEEPAPVATVAHIGSGDPAVGGSTPSTVKIEDGSFHHTSSTAATTNNNSQYFDADGYLNIANIPTANAVKYEETSKAEDKSYEDWQNQINPDRNLSKSTTFFGKGGDFSWNDDKTWSSQGYESVYQKTKKDSVIDPLTHYFDSTASWHADPDNIKYQKAGISSKALVTNKDGKFIEYNQVTGEWDRRISDADLAKGFYWDPSGNAGQGRVVEPSGKKFKTGVKQDELFEGFSGGNTPHHEGKVDYSFPEQRESDMFISGNAGVQQSEVQQILNSQRSGRLYNQIISDWQSKFLIRDPGVTKTNVTNYKNKVLNQIRIWKSKGLITASEKIEYEKDIKLRAKQVISTIGKELPRDDPMKGYSAETQWTLSRGAMGLDPGRTLSFEDLKSSNNKKMFKVKESTINPGSIQNFGYDFSKKKGPMGNPADW